MRKHDTIGSWSYWQPSSRLRRASLVRSDRSPPSFTIARVSASTTLQPYSQRRTGEVRVISLDARAQTRYMRSMAQDAQAPLRVDSVTRASRDGLPCLIVRGAENRGGGRMEPVEFIVAYSRELRTYEGPRRAA